MEVIEKIKSRRGIKELYDWQKEFFDAYKSLDKSVIVNAPTGAGKTIVAEAYILKCLSKGKKAVYIAPLRSLVFEKYNEWKRVYGWNIHVECGDFRKVCDNPDVYIFTFEKFLLRVINSKKFVDDIGVVVVDEIHSLIEDERGSLLEFAISLVKDDVIILGLSATVKNLHEIAKWLNCKVFSTVKRIVDVEVRFIHNNVIYDRYCNKVCEGSWLDVVVSKINEGKSVIVFVSKRSDTKKLASVISNRLREMRIESENDDNNEIVDIFGLPAEYGVAYHNGALNSQVRKMVESGFKSGTIRCIVATKTLAMGVNLPADVVVIKDLFYFEYGQMKPMKVIDVWQMIGRAGRHTKHGEAYLVAGKKSGMLKMVMNKYLYPDYEVIRSKLIWSKYFKLLILFAIKYLGEEVLKEDIYELFDNTFFKFFFVEGKQILRERIDVFIDSLVLDGFVEEDKVGIEYVYKLTEYGKLVCNFCVEPDIVSEFLVNIDFIEERFGYYEFISWMVIKGIFDFVSGRVREIEKYIDIMFSISDVLKISHFEYVEDSELIRVLKTIRRIWDWIECKDVDDMILLDLDSALRYISLFKILAKKENREKLFNMLDNLFYMIKYGVSFDLVEYVRQKGVGRKKALQMSNRYLKVK